MDIKNLILMMWTVGLAVITIDFAYAGGDPKKGASVFRQCMACHSIEAGRHLTGPSLANIWNRRAGTAQGFFRYSKALKDSNITWSAKTLDAWLKNPNAFVPGNYMGFAGIENPQAREDLIAYLETATASEHVPMGGTKPGGGMMGGMTSRPPLNLKDASAKQRVSAIRYCGDAYFVTLATGETFTFWEFNLRFKTDSGENGPPKGKPAIVRAGMMSDRAFIIFAGPEEMSAFITRRC
ncbi:MAG: c-type cytochrome [Acidiferrobacterales bacterium]